MKSRIFIGSSTEGLNIAQKVKDFFSTDFECYLWNDGMFKYNENYLETLLKEANLFDYGILVFTKDDFTKSREQQFESPRDNVVFEFGLFLGRLGKDNAFILQEENVKLPSDLFGITHATFKCRNAKKFCFSKNVSLDEESLKNSLNKLKRQIDEKVHLGVLGMLPSTVLAIGYFDNFVKPICESLSANSKSIEKYNCSSYRFRIILPKDLDSDIKKKANLFYKEKNYGPIAIDCCSRSYPLYVAIDKTENKAILSDMPTTLNGLDKAIEMYLQKGHIGKSNEQKLLEDRELRNFEKVLRALISEDADCRQYVEVETEK